MNRELFSDLVNGLRESLIETETLKSQLATMVMMYDRIYDACGDVNGYTTEEMQVPEAIRRGTGGTGRQVTLRLGSEPFADLIIKSP